MRSSGRGEGALRQALRNTRVLSFALIVAIAVCAVLIGVADLGTGWTVTLQIASAVAGAALGNVLRVDLAQHVVRNQARPATRHLFDQVTRLRRMVERADACQAAIQSDEVTNIALDHARIGDWFGAVSQGLRDEITSTATALENWGDLAKDVLNDEFSNYQTRDTRLPTAPEADRTQA